MYVCPSVTCAPHWSTSMCTSLRLSTPVSPKRQVVERVSLLEKLFQVFSYFGMPLSGKTQSKAVARIGEYPVFSVRYEWSNIRCTLRSYSKWAVINIVMLASHSGPAARRVPWVRMPQNVQNANTFCGLFRTRLCSSDRRQYCGALLRDLEVTLLIIWVGGKWRLSSRGGPQNGYLCHWWHTWIRTGK
jgi:hypothetical protein